MKTWSNIISTEHLSNALIIIDVSQKSVSSHVALLPLVSLIPQADEQHPQFLHRNVVLI